MDAFIRKEANKNEVSSTEYDIERDGKLTRTKMQKYIENITNEIKKDIETNEYYKDYSDVEKTNIAHSIPEYESVVYPMRVYGFGLKDVQRMEYKNDRYEYTVTATFYNDVKINIISVQKY